MAIRPFTINKPVCIDYEITSYDLYIYELPSAAPQGFWFIPFTYPTSITGSSAYPLINIMTDCIYLGNFTEDYTNTTYNCSSSYGFVPIVIPLTIDNKIPFEDPEYRVDSGNAVMCLSGTNNIWYIERSRESDVFYYQQNRYLSNNTKAYALVPDPNFVASKLITPNYRAFNDTKLGDAAISLAISDNEVNEVYLGDDNIYKDFSIYALNPILINATANPNNPTTIKDGENITLKFTANSGYNLPSSVTVINATYVWNQATGTLVLSNPARDVSFSIVGELPAQENDYLTFESDYQFSTTPPTTDGTLEYSTDASTWQTWSGSVTSVLNSITNKYTLYFRGEGGSYLI